jgi:hypothetical protein
LYQQHSTEDVLMSYTTIAELCTTLQTLLIQDARRLGRESGFIQRERKLNGASFVQSLVFGWQANAQASLEELCQSAAVCGVSISPQGLQERLNSPQAAQFLQRMLEQGLTYLVAAQPEQVHGLDRFTGIYLQDSTTIRLPVSLATDWRASGNQRSQGAGLKVQTVFNYQNGQLQLRLVEAVVHDCPLQTVDLPAGSLRLADLGYFKVNALAALSERSVWWLTRLPASIGVWTGDGTMKIATWLTQVCPGDQLDVEVQLTAQRFTCRLMAQRVPPDIAAQRREQARQDAGRRSHRLRPETLALCDWTVMITNLPPDHLTPSEALVLLRLRWQIELLFKLWKHTLALDSWRTQHPWQILTEVFAKLLLAVIQHWFLLLGCWGQCDRSLVKASLVLRKHAFHLATALSHFPSLLYAVHTILPSLARCVIHKRKAHPATFQLLECAFA